MRDSEGRGRGLNVVALLATLQSVPEPRAAAEQDRDDHDMHVVDEPGGKELADYGGSSADAQHLTAELVGRFAFDRKPLPAIALTTNQAILTAWSNDQSFTDVFARQIDALGAPGDVAWGISTSGTSANVVNGLRRARERGLRTIGMTGESGGDLAKLCDVLLAVPLDTTARIQEIHLVTYHSICAALERRLFGR